ncbi:stearoyl-CoA desaturase (delta-9 desaturase) [Chitinophaga sp. YR627]|uniref:fatty acid desaturase n=1 Tax=Chitinophaga sp. YR627 TaxID=1881041 RepID=UPI0008DEFFC3|nr:fatty acid desaturase [Chitinophaga sp. YR627]SFO88902.1 stearoyl-CoA desaturase (delta-9 desaturase) [Chitinophaga sp. YR627]
MSFIENVLARPSYGWKNEDGSFIKPTPKQLFSEFFSRLDITASRKNWLPFFSWLKILSLCPFFFIFIAMEINDFSIWHLVAGFVYGMIFMGTHGTIWYHRYGTHQAYQFSNKFWRFFTGNLVMKMIPDEIYIVSHHVHHSLSDKPGDPYNAEGGFLYCFLADVNHQPIAKDLSEEDYKKAVGLMSHTGIKANSYEEYQKWGSIARPVNTILGTIANWAFWITVFYLIGGLYLTAAILTGVFIWGVGVRTFNYEGHAKGEIKHVEGFDYHFKDKSINQWWPGIVAGEWHNNHHLYPASARSGFLKGQIDFAWYYIRTLKFIGGVSSFRDSKQQFMENYRKPYLEELERMKAAAKQPVIAE